LSLITVSIPPVLLHLAGDVGVVEEGVSVGVAQLAQEVDVGVLQALKSDNHLASSA
jgi:hypothetical protein